MSISFEEKKIRKNLTVFLYPKTPKTFKEGNNTYIKNLEVILNKEFKVINKASRLGLLNILFHLPKIKLIYFNWIEDVPDNKFGFSQVLLLSLILRICKIFNIKILWFIHNNISHSNKNKFLKKWVIKMMSSKSDLILSHSNEVNINIPKNKFHVFHHPVEPYHPLELNQPVKYDLLIWGTVSPYKGISEFVDFVTKSEVLKSYRILIAGKFNSEEYYNDTSKRKSNNVTIINKLVSENELIDLFKDSRYVLFTYNSPSVLSSAALCKSLSFGKEIIAPKVGAFKELGQENLLYNYDSFESLEKILNKLKDEDLPEINRAIIKDYTERINWNTFFKFICLRINNLYREQVA